MVDQPAPAEAASGPVCPWCSAELGPDATICPSCGANLTSDDEREHPGVTAVDHERLRTTTKKPPSRSRLLSWISGEYEPEGVSQVEAGALQPPDPNVQREILRLQLEAQVANLQAEADALYADAVVEGRVDDLPEGLQAIATGSALSDVAAEIDGADATSDTTEPVAEADATEPSAETDTPATEPTADAAAADDTADAPHAKGEDAPTS